VGTWNLTSTTHPSLRSGRIVLTETTFSQSYTFTFGTSDASGSLTYTATSIITEGATSTWSVTGTVLTLTDGYVYVFSKID